MSFVANLFKLFAYDMGPLGWMLLGRWLLVRCGSATGSLDHQPVSFPSGDLHPSQPTISAVCSPTGRV
jgi:hypothetical protein